MKVSKLEIKFSYCYPTQQQVQRLVDGKVLPQLSKRDHDTVVWLNSRVLDITYMQIICVNSMSTI